MGPGNTKLRDIGELKTSLRSEAPRLERMSQVSITSFREHDATRVARAIWSIMATLKVSVAEARIVANSRTLHHVLPSLVPPIDREYTLRFFYGRKMLSIGEDDAFTEMYVHLHRLATLHSAEITARIGKGWHTSETKVVDNAIVGYVLGSRAADGETTSTESGQA
jgi:hypothetical protein